jgi:flagellar basal-body rod protein FlgF
MENGIFVALSRQDALERQLAVIANNMANADTAGFKRVEMLMHDDPLPTRLSARRGGPAHFVHDIATVRDPSEGDLKATGNPLDLAVRGEGYFVVDTADGPRYTRDGHFRLDDTGQLVTEDGQAVLDTRNRPIVFTQADTRITVARDGTISSDVGTVDRLRLVRMVDDTQTQAMGDDLQNTAGTVEDITDPQVEQGMIEGSNVQPILELEQMIRVHRAYEQTTNYLDREDQRIRKVIDTYAV